ncbi:hypothetical protein ElyMa_000854800 [Elysia marginata]|uniref:Uncharacterized protein n=1 Tax=Elysia marginata TaxID=1093978 RepID=A0AAV4H5I4_9GAST|nr:hypothetical protein ElyMa_000854800 [Elysia marginata]
MAVFQDGYKEDTGVRNVVLQETSQGPMENGKDGDVGERLLQELAYKAETWVCWTDHERQLGTLATAILRGENRRDKEGEEGIGWTM